MADDEPCHFFFGHVCKKERTGNDNCGHLFVWMRMVSERALRHQTQCPRSNQFPVFLPNSKTVLREKNTVTGNCYLIGKLGPPKKWLVIILHGMVLAHVVLIYMHILIHMHISIYPHIQMSIYTYIHISILTCTCTYTETFSWCLALVVYQNSEWPPFWPPFLSEWAPLRGPGDRNFDAGTVAGP